MTTQLENIQLLYEIAMSIGMSMDLNEMSRISLSSLLKKLNCTGGAIFILKEGGDGTYQFEPVNSIPKSIGPGSMFQSALKQMPRSFDDQQWASFQRQLPLRIVERSEYYSYVLELPEFGVLILKKRGRDFDSSILISLDSILLKLAVACNNCLRNSELAKLHKLDKIITCELTQKTSELTESRRALMNMMKDMKQVEDELRKSKETLEQRVQERSRELSEMHSQMVMQEKMASVGQLAAGIAHELNNPINFVHTNFATLTENFTDLADILASYRKLTNDMEPRSYSSPELSAIQEKESSLQIDYILEDIPALFHESENGFKRIARIIQSMRDFSHVNYTGNLTYFNINKGIEDTLVIAGNVYKYHAEVRKELGELPDILCLPEQLNQVFLNLIVNSAQAIEAQQESGKGLITIRTWHEKQHICCEIADNGPGIPGDICSRIFEPFFTTKEPGKGTGLGLSISYDIIVYKHKGEMSVDCPETGGTVFTLRIPVILPSVEVCNENN